MSISIVFFAAIQLASPFADNMVLQRDRPVPVWGTGEPGEAIVVEFAGQRLETKAGGDGRWRVDLAPMVACSKGRVLTVCGGRGATALPAVAVNDVLVGEVWLCAGQSNMGVPLCGGNPRYRDRQGSLMAQMMHRPMIRYVSTPTGAWDHKEQKKTLSKLNWRAVLPDNLMGNGSFSAVALYFAFDVERGLACL